MLIHLLQNRRRLFWVLLVLTLLVMVIMNIVGAPLNNETAPSGIVSYELAGTPEKAQGILDSWDASAQRYAAFGLGFDYVFMLAYASLFSVAVGLAGDALRRRGWPLSWLGRPLVYAMWLAALMDAVENLALSVMLLPADATAVAPWPQLAQVCAVIKFGLLFIGLVYAFLGMAVSLVGRLETAEHPLKSQPK